MPSESQQHKLDQGRVRPPRVQITYDVETEGAPVKTELPFVVGVVADLSGQPKDPLKPLVDRRFAPIDRDNFNDVLSQANPRVAFTVPNRLSGDGKLGVDLSFKHMDDFEPARVADQVEPLRELLKVRQQLKQLLSRLEGNTKLEQLMDEVLTNTDKRQALAKELGIDLSGIASDAPKSEEPQ
jgi:type VI secretion system protein ImpB